MNTTNPVWQWKIAECRDNYDTISSPRGSEVRERIADQYSVPMPAYIDLDARKVNVPFMFAEAAWIISGSNRLEDIEPYMKIYSRFSDDQVFLRGAYGPKIVDQLGYVVDSIETDNDTRQAVINIWRERPAASKDIPCTTNMQFLLRDGKLNMVTTMRSNDIVLGFTYDVFTFSMVAKSVQLLLRARGIESELGLLTVTAGSLHIYERHYEQVDEWFHAKEIDPKIGQAVLHVTEAETYTDLIKRLKEGAENYGKAV
jgi:thymidylate synthase